MTICNLHFLCCLKNPIPVQVPTSLCLHLVLGLTSTLYTEYCKAAFKDNERQPEIMQKGSLLKVTNSFLGFFLAQTIPTFHHATSSRYKKTKLIPIFRRFLALCPQSRNNIDCMFDVWITHSASPK